MQPRNFKEDLEKSNNPLLRKSWEKLLRKKYGFFSEIGWKDHLEIQKGIGSDLTIKTPKGRRFSIELKTRQNSCYKKDWLMEIVSHIYDKEDKNTRKWLSKKEGWIYTTAAEYIFHATLNEDGTDIIEAILYTTMPFKTEKYKSEFSKYDNLWLTTVFTNGNFQLTLNKTIPTEVIKRDSNEFWYYNREDEKCN